MGNSEQRNELEDAIEEILRALNELNEERTGHFVSRFPFLFGIFDFVLLIAVRFLRFELWIEFFGEIEKVEIWSHSVFYVISLPCDRAAIGLEGGNSLPPPLFSKIGLKTYELCRFFSLNKSMTTKENDLTQMYVSTMVNLV